MYDWRKLTDAQRESVLKARKRRRRPWHSPPHNDYREDLCFIIAAACYEHAPIIGNSPERMAECEDEVLKVCQDFGATVYAWCILPNHYHLLVRTDRIKELLSLFGKFHGRSSYYWKKEENKRGRKVWFNSFERDMKSHRHFMASLNYVNNNAVHHGYVTRWQDWEFSSAKLYLEQVGRDEAERIWREYPILDYGKKWDVY